MSGYTCALSLQRELTALVKGAGLPPLTITLDPEKGNGPVFLHIPPLFTVKIDGWHFRICFKTPHGDENQTVTSASQAAMSILQSYIRALDQRYINALQVKDAERDEESTENLL